MSRKSPPLILGADTSSTYPSQNMPPLISVLKLFRKLITGDVLVTMTPNLSTRLSLIPSGSGVNRSLGGVSGFMVEVTQPPTQPGGSAGATTPSKFSTHGPAGGVVDGVGLGGGGVPPAVAVGVGVPPPPPPLRRS